jgi:hypothetical protein
MAVVFVGERGPSDELIILPRWNADLQVHRLNSSQIRTLGKRLRLSARRLRRRARFHRQRSAHHCLALGNRQAASIGADYCADEAACAPGIWLPSASE